MRPYDEAYQQDPEGGAAIVEFVIVFPMWVLMTLGIMQLALMHGASNIVQCAAFASARSAMVQDDTDLKDVNFERAARIVNVPITSRSMPFGLRIPAVPFVDDGASKMSGTFQYLTSVVYREFAMSLIFAKTKIKLYEDLDSDGKVASTVEIANVKEKIGVNCEHYFELVMPVVNYTFVQFLSFKKGIVSYGIGGVKEGAMQTDLMSLSKIDMHAAMINKLYQEPHAPINEKAILFRPWGNVSDFKDKGSGGSGSGSGSGS